MAIVTPGGSPDRQPEPPVDLRAVRVSVAPTTRMDGDPTITVAPPTVRLESPAPPVVDGRPVAARLEWLDDSHAILVQEDGEEVRRTPVLVGPARLRGGEGVTLREVVVDGWRVEVELESGRRAALRERARRGQEVAGRAGPLEVRAIIPGRLVGVSVAPGDAVVAGQQLFVLEAMKMQNELRSPRDGTIERIAVSVGQNVEVGDLIMVIS